MKRPTLILLFAILVLGFIVRLYHFSGPIADWHSWRQADTSAVSRNFVSKGFDVLHPRFDDLSNVPSGIDNQNGYRFVEFPIYNIAQAGLYESFGTLTLEQWGRLVTIFSSLISTIFIFLIVKKHQSELAGIISAFFFTLLPFNIFYGRTILPDSSTVAAILAGIYFFDVWTQNFDRKNLKQSLYLLLATVFITVALLLKPFAIFFTLPIAYLVFKKFGMTAFKKPELYIFVLISILPLLLWRIWMSQYPEGIPLNVWLFNDGNIRFKGAFFYWLFAERIGKLILGYFGIGILTAGFLTRIRKEPGFLYAFVLSSLLYISVIAKGNVQHDYYQILIVPTLCIFLGLGGEFLIVKSRELTNKAIGPLMFVVFSGFTIFFGWYFVRDFFNVNNPSIIAAGKAVDRLTPKDAKIIANYNGDTSFLYQTNRQGWASYEHDLPVMVKMGADYMVLVNPSGYDLNKAKNYKIVEKNDGYIIFNLHENP